MLVRGIIIALCAMLLALAGGVASGATFGNTSNLSGSATIESTIRGQIFTMPEDGVATSITAYLTTTTAAKRARCMIYKASDTSLVAVTEQRIIAIGTDVAETFNFNYTVNLTSGVDYILCAWSEAAGGVLTLSVDLFAGTGDSRVDTEGLTSYPPDPMIPTGHNASENSIYCTYTPGSQLTFGRTDIGTASTSIIGSLASGGGAINGGIFTTPASAVSVSGVTPHIGLQNTGSEIDTVQCAIYKQSDLSLVDTTYKILFYADTAVSGAIRLWRKFSFASPLTLSASTDYVLAVWAGYFSSSANVRLSTSGGQGREADVDETVMTWPATMSDNTDANDYVSIFADYTVVAGGTRLPFMLKTGWFITDAEKCFAGDCYRVEN